MGLANPIQQRKNPSLISQKKQALTKHICNRSRRTICSSRTRPPCTNSWM